MKSHLLKLLALFLIIGTVVIWQSEQTTAGKLIGRYSDSFDNSFSTGKVEDQTKQARIKEIVDSPVFSEFDERIKQFTGASFAVDYEQRQSDENLAIERMQLLKELAQISPQAVIEKAISVKDFNRLPDFITNHLEKPISANGDFLVYVFDEMNPSTGTMTDSHIEREVVIGDLRYKAVVYGRREAMTTKLDIPLQGIIIDDVMVVDENFVRTLNSSEIAARNLVMPTSNKTVVTAEVGGKVVNFSNESKLAGFIREQIEWESKIGPTRAASNGAETQLSPYTEGVKKILFYSCRFF